MYMKSYDGEQASKEGVSRYDMSSDSNGYRTWTFYDGKDRKHREFAPAQVQEYPGGYILERWFYQGNEFYSKAHYYKYLSDLLGEETVLVRLLASQGTE